jgi:ADP-heptose:LPS heptosyltransferase
MVGRDQIYFCVFEANRAILDLMDLVPPANVLTVRDRQLLPCLLDFLRVFRTLRKHRVDTCVDMEFFSRASAICAFLSGASKRVGLHRFSSELPYRGDLMTHRVQYTPYLHVSVQYSLLTMAIESDPAQLPLLKVPPPSGTTSDAPAMFVPTDQERRTIQDALANATPPAPIVLLNPNASDLLPLRKWPSDRFVALARRVLAAYPNALVIFTGAPSERAAADAMCAQLDSPRVMSLAGRTTLRELLTLYSLADILVTNDSGPSHFATLTPVATVVLFGPETPALFGPLSSTARVIWKQLACSPCVSVFNHRFSPCTDNVCMQIIEVDEVFQAVAESLAAGTK